MSVFDVDRFVAFIEQAADEASTLSTRNRPPSVMEVLQMLLHNTARLPESERDEIHRDALLTCLMLRQRLANNAIQDLEEMDPVGMMQ